MPDLEKLHGLSYEDMLLRRKGVTVQYYGHAIRLEYLAEKLTSAFITELLRLLRKGKQLSAKYQAELNAVLAIEPALDGPGSEEQDEAAEAVFAKMRADDDKYKRIIAEHIATVVVDWDLTREGKPYDVTVDNIISLDDELVTAFVGALLRGGQPLSKQNGRRSSRR